MTYEYDITKHSSDEFENLVYFCTEQGECSLKDVPADSLTVLKKALNEKGAEGWEMVQLFFGKDGVVGFWKKPG